MALGVLAKTGSPWTRRGATGISGMAVVKKADLMLLTSVGWHVGLLRHLQAPAASFPTKSGLSNGKEGEGGGYRGEVVRGVVNGLHHWGSSVVTTQAVAQCGLALAQICYNLKD